MMMMLLTSGLNDFCWSFIFRIDKLSVISVNSVTSGRCKIYFYLDFALKVLPTLMFLE